MNNKYIFLILVWMLLFSPVLHAQLTTGSDYRIGAQDQMEINVVGVKELNKITVRVSEDGKISLPLVGEMEVKGLTPSDIEKKIAQFLEEDLVRNPQVTVFVVEFVSKQVFVLGAVKIPGTYPILGKMSLLRLLSQAGGLTQNVGKEIIIIREMEDGSSRSINIPIEKLLVQGDINFNIPLEPNDTVSIPEDKIVLIYIMGQVKKPGALQVKRSNIPTLSRVIAMAGGFSERAKKTGVIIKWRDEEGKEHQKKVNVKDILKNKIKDYQLKENDMIYVPETLF